MSCEGSLGKEAPEALWLGSWTLALCAGACARTTGLHHDHGQGGLQLSCTKGSNSFSSFRPHSGHRRLQVLDSAWLCAVAPTTLALRSGSQPSRPGTWHPWRNGASPLSPALRGPSCCGLACCSAEIFFLASCTVVFRLALEGAQQAMAITQSNKDLLGEQSSFVSQLAFLEI